MIRAVLDSNVFISAIHFGGPPAKILKQSLEGKAKLFISREIIAEIVGVLRKKFTYEKEALEEIEDLLQQTCVLVEPSLVVKAIKGKPADNRILECALEAKADFIVSGDKKHLLPLKKFKGIKIVTPKKFLEILGE